MTAVGDLPTDTIAPSGRPDACGPACRHADCIAKRADTRRARALATIDEAKERVARGENVTLDEVVKLAVDRALGGAS